jgi:sugar phosphate isomerase/epimerase
MGMDRANIGIHLNDLALPLKAAMQRASTRAFRTVEVPAEQGLAAPAELDRSGRRHFARYAEQLGLSIPSLSADVPNTRLTDPATVDERIARTNAIIELAADLRVPVVTAAAGLLTHPATGEPSPLAVEALQQIAERADTCGVHFALRPGRDDAERLGQVLERVDSPTLQLGIDPGSLVMSGVNPLSLLERWPERIGLAHLRDGTVGLGTQAGQETALGAGEVDWMAVLGAISAADYRGPFILRRTGSEQPEAELEAARIWLERRLPPG